MTPLLGLTVICALVTLHPSLTASQSFMCPVAACSCYRLQESSTTAGSWIVDCRQRRLGPDVPAFQPSDAVIEILHLDGNSITRVKNDAFVNVPNIRLINLAANRLSVIEPHAFRGIEDSLEGIIMNYNSLVDFPTTQIRNMTKLSRVEATDNEIQVLEIPDGPPIVVLDLRRNNLTTIPNLYALKDTLRVLHLSNNSLTASVFDSLQELKQLGTLELSNNLIQGVPDAALSESASSMGTFIIRNNPLSVVSYDLLMNHKNLQLLDVSGHQLQEFDIGNTNGATLRLETLDLSNGQLQIFPTGLEQCPLLKTVHVRNNEISQVPIPTEELPISRLDMSSNEISEFPAELVAKCPELSNINLSNNKFSDIPLGAFSNNENLVTIDLSNSTIRNISEGSFIGPNTVLRELNLGNNFLTTLPRCSIYELESLQVLFLTGNQLECSCDLRYINEKRDKWIGGNTHDVKCTQPNSEEMQLFSYLGQNCLRLYYRPCPTLEELLNPTSPTTSTTTTTTTQPSKVTPKRTPQPGETASIWSTPKTTNRFTTAGPVGSAKPPSTGQSSGTGLKLSTPVIIVIGVFGAIILGIVIAVIAFCCSDRKAERKHKKHMQIRQIYQDNLKFWASSPGGSEVGSAILY